MTDFETRLTEFVAALNAHVEDHYKATSPECYARKMFPVIELSRGPKYIRVIARMPHDKSGSAHSFIDYAGNIYKTAGWKAPAKGIRGSIFDENYSIGKGVTVYGAAYRYR